MLELLQEQRELSELEVEERLERLHELNAEIAAAQKRRDAFQMHYHLKIAKAEDNFQADTKEIRAEIDSLTDELRRYAETHITGKRKSIKFPSGTLSLTKNTPNFFIDGTPVTNDNPKLIELVRRLDENLIATKEIAKWGEFKKRLVVDGNTVLLEETGEVIPDLRARTEPDKFSVTPA
ncbi:MAG: host-nuclease inhibitor Gam family protein [Selenomonadaceae bacterium]|nr:host-nuclease inhibitor Gam family protein [Selenomonadaceae bacterium]